MSSPPGKSSVDGAGDHSDMLADGARAGTPGQNYATRATTHLLSSSTSGNNLQADLDALAAVTPTSIHTVQPIIHSPHMNANLHMMCFLCKTPLGSAGGEHAYYSCSGSSRGHGHMSVCVACFSAPKAKSHECMVRMAVRTQAEFTGNHVVASQLKFADGLPAVPLGQSEPIAFVVYDAKGKCGTFVCLHCYEAGERCSAVGSDDSRQPLSMQLRPRGEVADSRGRGEKDDLRTLLDSAANDFTLTSRLAKAPVRALSVETDANYEEVLCALELLRLDEESDARGITLGPLFQTASSDGQVLGEAERLLNWSAGAFQGTLTRAQWELFEASLVSYSQAPRNSSPTKDVGIELVAFAKRAGVYLSRGADQALHQVGLLAGQLSDPAQHQLVQVGFDMNSATFRGVSHLGGFAQTLVQLGNSLLPPVGSDSGGDLQSVATEWTNSQLSASMTGLGLDPELGARLQALDQAVQRGQERPTIQPWPPADSTAGPQGPSHLNSRPESTFRDTTAGLGTRGGREHDAVSQRPVLAAISALPPQKTLDVSGVMGGGMRNPGFLRQAPEWAAEQNVTPPGLGDEAALSRLFAAFLKSDIARCSSTGGIIYPARALHLFESFAKLKVACLAEVKASPLTWSFDTEALQLKPQVILPDISDSTVSLSQFSRTQLKTYFKLVKAEMETQGSPLLSEFRKFKDWVNGVDKSEDVLFGIAATVDPLAEAQDMFARIGRFWLMKRYVNTPGENITMEGLDKVVSNYCARKGEMHRGEAFRDLLLHMGFTRPNPGSERGVTGPVKRDILPALALAPLASDHDLDAQVTTLGRQWEGINSKQLCKNCGVRNAHSATFCHKPRISSLPCQLCYGLNLSSTPHFEKDCPGCSAANTPLFIKLQQLLFLKRINGSNQAPAPAASPNSGGVGNGPP